MSAAARVVLMRPNDKKSIYHGTPSASTASNPPYWLALMGGWLRDQGVEVKLIDAEVEDLSPKDAARRALAAEPDLIGVLPIGTNLSASTWKMNGARLLNRALKSLDPGRPIFMWGDHVSALPERTIREESCDFAVVGEGFATILQLIEALVSGGPLAGIKGLWYRDGEEISGNSEMQYLPDLDALPYDGWELLPDHRYRNHLHCALEDLSKRDRYGAIMTSLGCPFKCTFCSLADFSGGRPMRHKSPQKMIEEVDYWVRRRDVYYLRVLDECFTSDRAKVMEFCRLLIERAYDLSIWTYTRTDMVDEELLETMARAGFRWIMYGFETGSPQIRKQVRKGGGYGPDQIRQVVEMTHKAGIHIVGNFMFGLPGETLEDMRQTLALAKELCCEHVCLFCTMAYPGSALYRQALEQGWELPETWLGYAQQSYETHPLPNEQLSAREILEFRDFAFQDYFHNNPALYQRLQDQFGPEAVAAVREMSAARIPRRLLGD